MDSSIPGVITTLRYPYYNMGRVEQHSIPVASNSPTKTSLMDGPETSQPEQISQQQQQQQLQKQGMGRDSQQMSQQQQQTAQGVQQQQQPQQARPKVVWSGIMEVPEVVSFIYAV